MLKKHILPTPMAKAELQSEVYASSTIYSAPTANDNEAERLEILLLEDSGVDVRLVKLSLDKLQLNYRLSVLNRGQQVLPYLQNNKNPKPDLVLIDLILPDVSGLYVLETLSKHIGGDLQETPIIIVSGHNGSGYDAHNTLLPVMGAITKPCKPVELRNAIIDAALQLGGAHCAKARLLSQAE